MLFPPVAKKTSISAKAHIGPFEDLGEVVIELGKREEFSK